MCHKARVQTRNPYPPKPVPVVRVQVSWGWGTGSPGKPQGYPCQSLLQLQLCLTTVLLRLHQLHLTTNTTKPQQHPRTRMPLSPLVIVKLMTLAMILIMNRKPGIYHKHEQNGTQASLIMICVHVTSDFILEPGMMHLWKQKTNIGYSFIPKIPFLKEIAVVFVMHMTVFLRLLLSLKMMVHSLTMVSN